MSPIINTIEKLQVTIPTEPGVYRLPFPEDAPTGHLILCVANCGNVCISFVPFPLQIFEDSEKAFDDDASTISVTPIVDPGADNVYVFRKTARISKNSA